ncbi:DUF5706 domain-containing protein [Arenibacter sp. GZD96]|uniref:Pycsar system effector family protein n=1 Tax=Aurantibrevibacter litoralis TaxID=3106030 RepID=UPI002AFE3A4E|nr:Pycsar system effector family protein [Arenibacter sp. GZD-96]MEA1785536.1 DUF5706 domain-containing protein [Arenibacter sp. GZD-96]
MSEIIEKTKTYVVKLLTENLDAKYLYHNLRHTQRVVKNTEEFINFYNLSGKEREELLLATWLHDIGYIKGHEAHEKSSCSLASEFLTSQGYTTEAIERICALIMATKHRHEPKGLLQEIIKDADSSHLAKKSYLETSELLRQELDLLGIASYSPREWRKENIKMFREDHRFYTEFAKTNWEEGKQQNLKILEKTEAATKKLIKKEKLKVKLKNESPERGIQTMFRVTMRNHLKLSDIADTKANILLSVNAIIISLVLANLIPKLDNPSNNYLIYPTIIFIVFSTISMVLSILATRPNVTRGEFTKEDVVNRNVNLLFFGNFHKMGLSEYEWAIQELIKDQEYVYKSLIKDLYFLGKVLDRKYRILRITYTIFMTGIIVSVISFGIAFKYFGPVRIL